MPQNPVSTQALLAGLPHSTEAERTVLGAFLLDPECAQKFAPIVAPEDFYDPTYRIVFEGIRSCLEDFKTVDFVLLASKLNDNKKIYDIGGSAFLAQLVMDVPTASHAPIYISILKKRRAEREAINIGSRVEAMGREQGSAGNIPAYLIEQSRRLSEIIPRSGETDRQDLIDELTSEHKTIPTGFLTMDQLLNGGLSPGDLFLIAARPSVGKSALATTITANLLKSNVKSCFFSLEMSRRQILTRILCAYYDLTPLQVKARAKELVEGIKTDMEIYIGSNDLSTLQQEALSTDAEIIIIDYFGLITMPSRENRFQVMDEISRSIKNLAIHIGKPIIMLTQLNREIEKDKGNREPYLADLFGGGEKDADVISFLWDPHAKDKETAEIAESLEGGGKELKWIVRKHRNGPTGTIDLRFHAEKFTMREETQMMLPRALPESSPKSLPLEANNEEGLPF